MAVLVVVIIGLVVFVGADSVIRRRSGGGSALGKRYVQLTLSAALGFVVALVLYFAFVGGGGSVFTPYPKFASLKDHPDNSLVGTVAYNPLAIGSPKGKFGCVDVVAASGGPSKQLFCASQPKAMGANLKWLPDGRLQATDQYQARWIKVVDVTTGAIQDLPGVKVTMPVNQDRYSVSGPKGQTVSASVSRGTLKVTLDTSAGSRTLLSVAVPREYGIERPAWSPDGRWVVQGGSSGLLVITTGAHPTTRVLIANGYGAAVTNASY